MITRIKQLIRIYGWQFAVEATIICVIIIWQLVVLFIPSVAEWAGLEAIFRLIVLIALGHILFRLTSFSPQKLAGIEGVVSDDEAKDAILEAAREYKSRRVTVLSSGLSSRHEFLLSLSEAGLEVEVFYQDPYQATDVVDGNRIEERIDALKEKFKDIEGTRECDFFSFKQPATIRCALLYDSKSNPCFAQIGWYSYTWSPERMRVFGSQHPSLLVSKRGKDGIRMLEFVAKITKELRQSGD